MLYKTICADPPWILKGGKSGQSGWSSSASPDAHYKLMRTDEIAALPVAKIAAPDSHLYLWVVNGLLPDGLRVMESWGFRYVNNVCWGKTSGYGLGQYFRGQHELLLFGVRGRPGYKLDQDGRRMQARSLILAPRRKHSEKPDEARKLIEHVSSGPFIELFARKRIEGWHVWGDEVESDVDLLSFQRQQAAAEGPEQASTEAGTG